MKFLILQELGALDHVGRSAEMVQSPGEVLTIEDLVQYLKIPKSTLYKLAQEGKLPGQKVGRHWRFRKEAIDRWLEQRTGPYDAETKVTSGDR